MPPQDSIPVKTTTGPRPGQFTAMISSTALDLPEHRKEVMDACLRMGMHPVMMEHLTAGDVTAAEKSLAMVDDASIYLGVFAYRYCHVPEANNPEQLSVTEMEYNRAVERGIPRLIFLMDKTHPLTAADMEEETSDPAEAKAGIRRMCEQLLTNPLIESYEIELAK